MKTEDVYRVQIEKLDHYGRGIAHIGGKIVFIPYTLPLEDVDVKIVLEKKKYMEAIPIAFHSYSKDRRESICPYFGKCGGCDLLHLSYEKQLLFKENKVKEILGRFGSVDTTLIAPIISLENITFYRNKATFKVKEKIGYYGKKSYDLIPIDTCQIVHPKINKILKILNQERYLSSITDIVIRISHNEESMIIFSVEEEKDLNFTNLDQVANTIICVQNGAYKVVKGKRFIDDQIGSYSFKISPTSFFQVNRFTTQKLYDVVYNALSLTGKETVLDLYCGTGTLGIYASDKASKIIGVEVNPEAVENARENAKKNSVLNSHFICQNLTKFKKDSIINDSIDILIVDPPRAGLEGDALPFLMKQKIPKMIYVSCDPVTLARDLKELQKIYNIIKVVPVDMFPHTYHVECVCVLKRR